MKIGMINFIQFILCSDTLSEMYFAKFKYSTFSNFSSFSLSYKTTTEVLSFSKNSLKKDFSSKFKRLFSSVLLSSSLICSFDKKLIP